MEQSITVTTQISPQLRGENKKRLHHVIWAKLPCSSNFTVLYSTVVRKTREKTIIKKDKEGQNQTDKY